MNTHNYPIQGNQFFQKVENTVVSSQVEDVLHNSQSLVTHVVKGVADMKIQSEFSDPRDNVAERINVFTDLTKSSRMVLPAGALVTRILISTDKLVDSAKRVKFAGSTFSFHMANSDTDDDALNFAFRITPDDAELEKHIYHNVVVTNIINKYTSANRGLVYMFQDGAANNSNQAGYVDKPVVDGTLCVEIHYVVPLS